MHGQTHRAAPPHNAGLANFTALPHHAMGPPDETGGPPMLYWLFSTSDLYNWKTQNAKFSDNPKDLIGLLDSVLFTHQPTWEDCQQLLQVLFTTEKRERIKVEARKSVLGEDRQPTQNPDLMNAAFPLSHPTWDYNSAEAHEQVWPKLKVLYETGPPPDPHRYRPGDWVYVWRHQQQTLQPGWKGPHIMILTTPMALIVNGITPWVHYTHVWPADPHTILKDFVPVWKSQPNKDNPLKLRLCHSHLPH
ncbi:unnamed protein product [Nyctereutes procyonoides]|uniref:(raccoon dog) hypothetical protein n=1 Tax=Nyctereutes procyonoides TaxID=34880 RepID=A0A811Z0G6_NYCPR|nr:unnamed protein product [Nyctereutes procyonoides]